MCENDLGICNFAAAAYSTEEADLYPGNILKQDGTPQSSPISIENRGRTTKYYFKTQESTMAAEQATHTNRPTASPGEDVETPGGLAFEHLSILPVTGAAVAVVYGAEWAWTVAAMLLAIAYLGTYIGARR
ncbi:MAG: hypothetical protein ABEI77_07870 [Halorientalis sp.]